jgi:hypothetical protein
MTRQVVNIREATHTQLVKYCKSQGIKVGFFVDDLINTALKERAETAKKAKRS